MDFRKIDGISFEMVNESLFQDGTIISFAGNVYKDYG